MLLAGWGFRSRRFGVRRSTPMWIGPFGGPKTGERPLRCVCGVATLWRWSEMSSRESSSQITSSGRLATTYVSNFSPDLEARGRDATNLRHEKWFRK